MNGSDHIEHWLPCPGFDGYAVSSLGRVRNNKTNHILKPCASKGGYLMVTLPRRTNLYVHRLVCIAFYGLPDGNMFCRHLDGNQTNNMAYNLAWGTAAQNAADYASHGRPRSTRPKPITHHLAALCARTLSYTRPLNLPMKDHLP